MRIANRHGRSTLITDAGAIDISTASDGRFPADPLCVYQQWDEFVAWATTVDTAAEPYTLGELGPVVTRPPQVFAIGLNYASHAGESGFAVPTDPVVFTKFASSLAGPDIDVQLTGDRVDWEAELVAVISRGGRDIREVDAWDHIAGLTVGQDLSDRTIQFWGDPPQFSLGKSLADFAPVGPWTVTLDEVDAVADRSDLRVVTELTEADGTTRTLQSGRTRDMIFTIPTLVARLSAVVELLPGDLIFTGTPDGVGIGRDPQEFLRSGQTITTCIEGVGQIVQRFHD